VKAAVLLLLFLGIATPAFAWSGDGHRVVCTIAWDETTAATHAGIGALLDIKSKEQFIEACQWLDTQANTQSWHKISVPKSAREIDRARDCAAGCALTHVERSLEVLRSKAPKAQRAEALKVLAHLIAELHQPLNVAFSEDGGGETIKGTFRGRAVTLRALWEKELLATILNPDSPNGFLTVYGYFSLDGRAPRLGASTPFDWATETFWIMRTPATGYVGNPGGLDYDDTYVQQNRRIALEQLDKAGVRLATLLTEIFGGS
jgi:hypothetical protein